jgi:hypothetical protein
MGENKYAIDYLGMKQTPNLRKDPVVGLKLCIAVQTSREIA